MNNSFNIVGVDPGSNYVGVSVLNINSSTFQINSIASETINLSKIKSRTEPNYDITYKMDNLLQYLISLFNTIIPSVVSIENPFMFSKRPGAVIPLAKSLAIIEQAAITYNDGVLIYRISPSEVKNAIGAKGNADKDTMLTTLEHHSILRHYIDIERMSEHEIDAVAMGYGAYMAVCKNPYLLMM